MIHVVVYDPGKPGRVIAVPASVGMFQALVLGLFDVFYDSDTNTHVYHCDAAFSLGLARNRRFGANDVVGTAVFARQDQLGNILGLADADVERIRARYG